MTKIPLYACHIKRLWLYMFLAALSISRSEEVTQLVQSKRTEAPVSTIRPVLQSFQKSMCFVQLSIAGKYASDKKVKQLFCLRTGG